MIGFLPPIDIPCVSIMQQKEYCHTLDCLDIGNHHACVMIDTRSVARPIIDWNDDIIKSELQIIVSFSAFRYARYLVQQFKNVKSRNVFLRLTRADMIHL